LTCSIDFFPRCSRHSIVDRLSVVEIRTRQHDMCCQGLEAAVGAVEAPRGMMDAAVDRREATNAGGAHRRRGSQITNNGNLRELATWSKCERAILTSELAH
jgi:hypothetical protein